MVELRGLLRREAKTLAKGIKALATTPKEDRQKAMIAQEVKQTEARIERKEKLAQETEKLRSLREKEAQLNQKLGKTGKPGVFATIDKGLKAFAGNQKPPKKGSRVSVLDSFQLNSPGEKPRNTDEVNRMVREMMDPLGGLATHNSKKSKKVDNTDFLGF